jgi:hypothetical protein
MAQLQPCLRKVFAAQLAGATAAPGGTGGLLVWNVPCSALQVQGVVVLVPEAGPLPNDCVYALDDGTGTVPLQLAADLFSDADGALTAEGCAAHAKLPLGAFVSVWGPPVAVQQQGNHAEAGRDGTTLGVATWAWGIEVRQATCVREPCGCSAGSGRKGVDGVGANTSPGTVASSAGSGAAPVNFAALAPVAVPDANTVWVLEVLQLWGSRTGAAH